MNQIFSIKVNFDFVLLIHNQKKRENEHDIASFPIKQSEKIKKDKGYFCLFKFELESV